MSEENLELLCRGIDEMNRVGIATTDFRSYYHPVHYEFRDLGERVLAWGIVHVRARGSGIETDLPSAGVFEFRDGKIVRWEDFGSKDKALKAFGVEE